MIATAAELSDDILSKLILYPQAMAAAVKPWLAEIHLENYLKFLDMMYHYTLRSGQRLTQAAHTISHPDLARLFNELSLEEANHFRLAEYDLSQFNCKPSQTTPPEVIKFEQFWAKIDCHHQSAYLGALYALENVGQFLHSEAVETLQRIKIRPEQARFIMVHLEADLEHGERLGQLCSAHGTDDTQSLLMGADQASQFWIELHRRALVN